MDFLIWLMVGGLVGWITSMVTNTQAEQGILLNVVIRAIGALLCSCWPRPTRGTGPRCGSPPAHSLEKLRPGPDPGSDPRTGAGRPCAPARHRSSLRGWREKC